jgi:hypothetical protein
LPKPLHEELGAEVLDNDVGPSAGHPLDPEVAAEAATEAPYPKNASNMTARTRQKKNGTDPFNLRLKCPRIALPLPRTRSGKYQALTETSLRE